MKAKVNNITIIFLGTCLPVARISVRAFAEDNYLIPGDARKGWQVFSEKGCLQCHGMGEKGKNDHRARSLEESHCPICPPAAWPRTMWNHAPEMWEKMSAKWIKFKRLNETEMADLFAFLYFIRYLDEPGNAAKGKEVLKTKGCTECHSISGKGRKNRSRSCACGRNIRIPCSGCK